MSAKYGWDHQKATRELKKAMQDGDPCCRCGQPMYRFQLAFDRHDPRGIEADHFSLDRVLGGALPDALAHRRCNRRAGALLRNRLHGRRWGGPRKPRPTLPSW